MKRINNDEAVSPVIGTILMVVITVIIAAVLAVFVFGVGSPAKVPATKFKMETDYYNPNQLYITNVGGDTLILDELSITVTNQNRIILQTNTIMKTWAPTYNGTYFAPGNTAQGTITKSPASGDIIEVLITHLPSGQMIADTKIPIH